MATALVVEEDHGTSRGHVHPHNGYFAGAFGRLDSDEGSGRSRAGEGVGRPVRERRGPSGEVRLQVGARVVRSG